MGNSYEGEQQNRGNSKDKAENFSIKIQGISHAKLGEDISNNQDRILVVHNTVGAVFDGVASSDKGDVAATLAAEFVQKAFVEDFIVSSVKEAEILMEELLRNTSTYINDERKKMSSDMSTTASVVYIYKEDNRVFAITGNVGDSRIYLLREGELGQVTLDDGLVRKTLGSGGDAYSMQEKLNNLKNFKGNSTNDMYEKVFFSSRNEIFQSIGNKSIEPRIFSFELQKGDKVLITSDGIPDNLTSTDIERILNSSTGSNTDDIEKLISKARDVSQLQTLRSNRDDMSAVLISTD